MDIKDMEFSEKRLEISLEDMNDDEITKFKTEMYQALYLAIFKTANEQKKAKIRTYSSIENSNNTLSDDEFKKLKDKMQNIINQKKNREVLERLKNK
ncbi:hypothetical protein [Campylobacter geochelonis]|uniref:Uncharacterized protein n=1 Tax=Campylobacter geochelonis TaxID=1780362 RepID=A0A128EQF6_9BACT|nr:hypothetical protein [Campylobacter geochelonis]QKF71867.1 hypothetical protein CGEO_1590 [Campylobacter geochelonis]CZE47044.1 Uncharacterised protein [Campylobacter geochelonis]CZE47376.1 Uncharacterised protein [Campylobacter geochelonis]CZE50973.1 Uncharacterised protein [Campylobacter geochelonis]